MFDHTHATINKMTVVDNGKSIEISFADPNDKTQIVRFALPTFLNRWTQAVGEYGLRPVFNTIHLQGQEQGLGTFVILECVPGDAPGQRIFYPCFIQQQKASELAQFFLTLSESDNIAKH